VAPGVGPETVRIEADGEGGDDRETELARFTEWFRCRPNSFEFWGVVVTDRRLCWRRVGESFTSMLLHAGTDERGRERVDEDPFAERPGPSDANFTVPLSALRRIELREGSLLRRASLTLAWADDPRPDPVSGTPEATGPGTGSGTRTGAETEWTLYNTSRGDAQVGIAESLARDERLSGVEPSGRLF
jgi:hypothetical protein